MSNPILWNEEWKCAIYSTAGDAYLGWHIAKESLRSWAAELINQEGRTVQSMRSGSHGLWEHAKVQRIISKEMEISLTFSKPKLRLSARKSRKVDTYLLSSQWMHKDAACKCQLQRYHDAWPMFRVTLDFRDWDKGRRRQIQTILRAPISRRILDI